MMLFDRGGVGLDGELVKYVVSSMAPASGSMASASGSAALAAGGFLYNRTPELKLDNGVHNVKLLGGAAVSGAGAAVSGAGLVFNVAAGTARATASTGSVFSKLDCRYHCQSCLG